MRVADRRYSTVARLARADKKRKLPRWLKVLLIVLGVLAAVFLVANIVMFALYRNKVLPNYSVASVAIGGVNFDELADRVPADKLLPQEITLEKSGISRTVAPQDLGVQVDWSTTIENIKQTRSWLPLTSLVFRHTIPAELDVSNTRFASSSKELESVFQKEPLPERVAAEGGDFVIAPPEDGFEFDALKFREALISALEEGRSNLEVPTKVIASSEQTGGLEAELAELRKKLDARIVFRGGEHKKQLSRAEIVGLFEQSGRSLEPSDVKIVEAANAAAAEFGVSAVNQSEAAMALRYALNKLEPVEFVLAPEGATVHRYCVAARGLDSSVLGEYREKLAAVYADPRGWNDGGRVAFVYVEDDCDYTAWLSSAAEVTSFSPVVCDNYYSCRVGANVIVNYDRWMGATDSWNNAGGNLEDYRVMVINHETGHWLGFGHSNCPGEGQPAPVMQQQSINLQGCTFNAWPVESELARL